MMFLIYIKDDFIDDLTIFNDLIFPKKVNESQSSSEYIQNSLHQISCDEFSQNESVPSSPLDFSELIQI